MLHRFYHQFILIISVPCTNGFPSVLSQDRAGSTGDNSNELTTRLFPDMEFRCSGKIESLMVAVNHRNSGRGISPRVQVWRENRATPGVYYKTTVDIPISKSLSYCTLNNSTGLMQCDLRNTSLNGVQSGDILGLELPAPDSTGLEIVFVGGNSFTSLVFRRRLLVGATVTLSMADATINEQPLLNFFIAPNAGMQYVLECICVHHTI